MLTSSSQSFLSYVPAEKFPTVTRKAFVYLFHVLFLVCHCCKFRFLVSFFSKLYVTNFFPTLVVN